MVNLHQQSNENSSYFNLVNPATVFENDQISGAGELLVEKYKDNFEQ